MKGSKSFFFNIGQVGPIPTWFLCCYIALESHESQVLLTKSMYSLGENDKLFGIVFAYVVVVASGSTCANVVICWYCGNM